MQLLVNWLCIFLVSIVANIYQQSSIDLKALKSVRQKQISSSFRCSPDWQNLDIKAMAESMIPLPGSGSWNWKISTGSDSAQFYFNQGMNLYYGFHIVEAVPSFRKAQQFDSTAAMLYWGEALALGPNINDMVYGVSVEATNATAKARQYQSGATTLEQALISSMQLRYSTDSTAVQARMNEQYAASMKKVYSSYGNQADIATLYADALMLLHPWNFWHHDGTAQPWTPEIIEVLEAVLKSNPNHPGANHYYIHTVEASNHPDRANASADRLASLAPSLSHVVHMPSHIYIRTGQFDKGINTNTAALNAYNSYLNIYPAVAGRVDLYEIHNRHMQAACAINLDDYQRALQLAIETRKSVPSEWLNMPDGGYYMQYTWETPELIMIGFRKWDDILKEPAVSKEFVYSSIIQSFARGLAYIHTGALPQAQEKLALMEELMKDSSLAKPMGPLNAPLSGATVAYHILAGEIAAAKGDKKAAIDAYTVAVEKEDAMVYGEPRDWIVPARRWLGAALLEKKDYKQARSVFEADLRINPGSISSKNGLAAATARKKS